MELYKNNLTIEEYVQHEAETGLKHEYHNGMIFPIENSSLNHGLLCGNIYSEVRNKLRNINSENIALIRGVKLHIQKTNSFVYPDLMVFDKGIGKSDKEINSVINPKLIAEITSKSSGGYDRGDKFYLYRQISSLQEYLIIDESRYIVDTFLRRKETDLWEITRYEGLDKNVILKSLDIEFSVGQLYYDIKNRN